MNEYKDFDNYTWCSAKAKDSDVVVSTRIRLARNLKDYPFFPRLDKTGAEEIIDKVKAVPGFSEYSYTDFGTISPMTAASFAERHIVSPEFTSVKIPHGLLADPEKGMYIMICEEDHVRLQCIKAGLALKEAYEAAESAEEAMDVSLDLAYDSKFGYLTHCPTNLGTGLRASVMLFLPAISAAGELRSLQSQLVKLGLTVRGMSGEGSSADGCLYQISNQVTLGISEEETVEKLSGIVESIVNRERTLRDSIKDEMLLRLRDNVRRAMGIMRYAEVMETKELFDLYSKVRLGAAMGMTDGIKCETFDRLLFSSMPATITAETGEKVKSPIDRDTVRAAKARAVIAG